MKKRHFYAGRIKALSIALSVMVLGLFAVGFASSDNSALDFAKSGAAICFTAPIALVSRLKGNGSWDKMDEAQRKFIESLEGEVNDAFKKASDGQITNEQLTAKMNEWGKGLSEEQFNQFKDMAETIKKQAEAIQSLKDAGLSGKEMINPIMKALKDNEEKIKSFRASKTGKLSIEVKAGGADQAATDIATHTIGDRVPGIGQLPVRNTFMRQLFPTVPCNSEFVRYLDQETVVRNAQNVASAAASTHTTKLTWKERNIQIAAVRDMVDVPIDMLEDYDFVEGELRNLLGVNVQLKIDDQLLNGTGVNPYLHSVNEFASEFDHTNTSLGVWTGVVKDPNFFDLAIAMASQVIQAGSDGSFMPNTILVNTTDYFKNILIKDANGQYVTPPFVARVGNREFNVDGMRVISNPNVSANTMYVFDSSKGTIYQRKGAVIEMSYENATNFETEVVTLKAYERLNLLVRNVNANAFMKCTDVATALGAIKS